MTFGRCKVFQRDIKGRGFELPHQGVSSVGERGHRLTERRPPFLGGEQALAVKDANPRISRIDKTRALILPWGRITRSLRRGADAVNGYGSVRGSASCSTICRPRGPEGRGTKSLTQSNLFRARIRTT
jgi:hypothetical protein